MLAELRVTPVHFQGDFADLIARVVRVIASSSLQYCVHALGTSLEGDLEEILDVVRRCHEEVRKHSDRALIELSLDDRGGAQGELVRSLQRVRDLNIGIPLERLVRTG